MFHPLRYRPTPACRILGVRRKLGAHHPALRRSPDRLLPPARGHQLHCMGTHQGRVACGVRILPGAPERRRRGAGELRICGDAPIHPAGGTHLPRGGPRYLRPGGVADASRLKGRLRGPLSTRSPSIVRRRHRSRRVAAGPQRPPAASSPSGAGLASDAPPQQPRPAPAVRASAAPCSARVSSSDPIPRYQLRQVQGLRGQRLRRRGGCLHQRDVLLRHIVHHRDRPVHRLELAIYAITSVTFFTRTTISPSALPDSSTSFVPSVTLPTES